MKLKRKGSPYIVTLVHQLITSDWSKLGGFSDMRLIVDWLDWLKSGHQSKRVQLR